MGIRQSRNEDATINLTPMIDVVFLLVIFFMVGSRFNKQEGRIPVNVPGVGQPQSMVRGPDKRVVEVTREGKIFLDGEEVSVEQLTSVLATAGAQYPDLGVVVRGDAAGTLDTYARVLSACSNAGIQRLDVAVQQLR
jgi:biopolymer transport protein ExbD